MSFGSDRLHLCVVTCCHNEEEVIRPFFNVLTGVLSSLDRVDSAIVVVDDGSTDKTLAILNEIERQTSNVFVYSLSRNFGHQVAITCGLEAARGADVVVTLDSDLQHPPSLIPLLLDRHRAGIDVVQAVRTTTEGVSLLKRVTSHLFYSTFNWLSETQIRPGAADFMLLSRRAHEALLALPERRRFLRGLVAWIGFPSAGVPYQAPARHAGVSKYTAPRMVRLALDAVFSFSSSPIRLATRAGIAVSATGALYLGYVLARALAMGDLVQGWASLISVTVILGGLQLTMIGLIGEYIARIFDESKERPLYLLKQRPARPLWQASSIQKAQTCQD